jgi:hypothetical protein
MKVIDNKVYLTRGDTGSLTLNIKDEKTNLPYLLKDDDVLYFTVKKNINTNTKSFQKVITSFNEGVAEIFITNADTKDLPFGEYVYDCQVTSADGSINTVIKPKPFYITEEVTNE